VIYSLTVTYDEVSTQASIVAASKEAAGHSHEIRNVERAGVFVQELCDLLGIDPIPVSAISPEQAEEIGHTVADQIDGVSPSEAFVVEGRREILIVDAGQQPLVRGLLLFHEVAHVVCPTDPPHGPAFVRAWLDLCRRSGFYEFLADSWLESALLGHGVAIDEEPSPLAPPRPNTRPA
jgi:hypothetical protein